MAAESYLKRKVGPLKMYQWIGLGVIAGLGVLLYNRRSGEGPEGEVFGGTGTGAFGPINPETGVPYAFEGVGGAAGTAGEGLQTVGEAIDLLGTLRELFGPEETNDEPTPAADALPLTPAGKKKAKKTRQQRREDAHGAGAKKPKDKAKRKPPATSTGGAGHQAQPHTSAGKPIAKIANGIAVATSHAAIGPGHAVGNGRPKTVRKPAVTHSAAIGGNNRPAPKPKPKAKK